VEPHLKGFEFLLYCFGECPWFSGIVYKSKEQRRNPIVLL
jgi:hypothetical protein